jgi:hypothetical protein
MRPIAAVALLLAMTGLVGCVSISAVPPGPVALGDSHQVVLARTWSDVSVVMPQRSKKVRVLSIDGPLLNRLYLAQGLVPGEGLITPLSKERPVPAYHADMAPTELVEFVSDSIAAIGYQRVETSKLRPAKFGQTEALRFDVTAQTDTGLEMMGTAEVAVAGGKLYLVLYLAPAEHYYPANLPDVEDIIGSAA